MADLGLVESELAGLSQERDKPLWKRVMRELVKTISFGPVDVEEGQRACINMRGHLYGPVTTPAVANTEFSVTHLFGGTPYGIVPYLPNETDAEIIPLKWARAWDNKRVYLKSSATNARIFFYLEG